MVGEVRTLGVKVYDETPTRNPKICSVTNETRSHIRQSPRETGGSLSTTADVRRLLRSTLGGFRCVDCSPTST